MTHRHAPPLLLVALAVLLAVPPSSIAAARGFGRPKEETQTTQTQTQTQTPKMVHKRDAAHPRRFVAGPPTEIDCAASASDFEYYLERCHDGITQWWANGRCADGIKAEVSELHRCQSSRGNRPYCHDCRDGKGNVKHVCGADSPDAEAVCPLALGSDPERDCPDDGGAGGLTSYGHRCTSRQTSSYEEESIHCDAKESHGDGPEPFVCGQKWYYTYRESDDASLRAADPSLVGEAHPFSAPKNEFCLDCGRGIQVCASDPRATCEDLGLPPRGYDAAEEANDAKYEGGER